MATAQTRRRAVQVLLLCVPLLSSCSAVKWGDDGLGDYKKAASIPPLQIPEQLQRISELSDAFSIPGEGGLKLKPDGVDLAAAMPKGHSLRLERQGELFWLASSVAPPQLWPHLVNFWKVNSFPIQDMQKDQGVILTDWVQIRGSSQGAEALQQYRLRLTPVETGSRVFITVRKRQKQGSGWDVLPPEPQLEAATLTKLRTYLAGL